MPTLDFKGKPFVYSHHLSVPFRELIVDEAKSLPEKGQKPGLDGNLIIHGDNLEALKALLPRYAGKVDVIYIDPPYNTGKEGWRYNDNVKSPLAQAWFGKEVDVHDLERHDKWLCMMWPRLSLLQELCSDQAVIMVSIDDNEMHSLRLLMDDIFGPNNFLGQVTVEVNPKGRGLKDSDFAKTHEYVAVYQASKREWQLGVGRDEAKERKDFPKQDEDGRYRTPELRNTHREFGRHNRANLWYALYGKADGTVSLSPAPGRVEIFPVWPDGYEGCWTWDRKAAERQLGLLIWSQQDGRNAVYRKAYSRGATGDLLRSKLKTIWKDPRYHTEKGNAEARTLKLHFENPKPVALIHDLLATFPQDDLVILDSFAGSGTTGHAVLKLNKADGGSRKFILIETEDYADSVTGARIRSVIEGAPKSDDDDLKEGLGGSFTYCELGEPMDLERFFAEDGKAPSWDQVARYVAYTATGETLVAKQGKDGFAGSAGHYRLHLLYRNDPKWMRSNAAMLDLTTAERIAKAAKGKPTLVFAAGKLMGQRVLTELGLTFCQLPYSVHRILGEGTEGVAGVDAA